MNSKLLWSTCLVLFVNNVAGQWAIDDDGCTTPFRGSGSCVVIFNCQPIITFLRNAAKPISQANSELLRRYQCGFEENNIKVCCPSAASEISRLEGTTTTTGNTGGSTSSDSSAPDVSNHRNLQLLPQDCGNINVGERIINGNETGLYEFPWMALLSYRFTRGRGFGCGGTIINDRYILTAAHCISGQKYPLLGVRLGEHDTRTRTDCETIKNKTRCAPPVQDMAVGRLIPHPRYNATSFTNDIGLIRLASRMNFLENVAPVCLPATEEAGAYNYTARKVIVTGFGATESGSNSPTLLQVHIPYIERSECRRVHQNNARISDLQICAGGRNKQDSCAGDSGGPLQVAASMYGEARYVQQGITSFGPRNCGAEGIPGVYTRVSHYMDWILDNISS